MNLNFLIHNLTRDHERKRMEDLDQLALENNNTNKPLICWELLIMLTEKGY
jgi:hypothetical protein